MFNWCRNLTCEAQFLTPSETSTTKREWRCSVMFTTTSLEVVIQTMGRYLLIPASMKIHVVFDLLPRLLSSDRVILRGLVVSRFFSHMVKRCLHDPSFSHKNIKLKSNIVNLYTPNCIDHKAPCNPSSLSLLFSSFLQSLSPNRAVRTVPANTPRTVKLPRTTPSQVCTALTSSSSRSI